MFRHDILVKLFAKLKQLKIVQALQQECGSILVFTAVGIPTLLALIGFGFDVGNLYMHKARLQNVADAAALAGARAYVDNLDTTKGGTVTNGDIPSKPNHANDVAREYIAKNSINLPNDIYHDFNSLMIRESDESNTLYPNKAFYRIGLYENVPLYFLPIIKGVGKTQKVRAEAIAIAIPGTASSEEQPQQPQPLNTSGYSIFKNLFTYSNSLDIGKSSYIEYQNNNLTGSSEVRAGFDGNIVYTFQNADISKVDKDQKAFFNDTRIGIEGGNPDYNNVQHYYEEICKFTGEKNDPTINMRNGTEDYYNAFIKKLITHPFAEVNNQNFYISVPNTNQNQRIYNISNSTGSYKLIGNDYYVVEPVVYAKNSTNNTISDVILYHKFPNQNEYVRCIKRINDNVTYYYLVNTQDQIVANSYITSKPNPNWWPPTIEEAYGITSLSDYKNNGNFPSTLSNFQSTTSTAQLNDDVFFATYDKIGSSTLTIYINDKLSASGNRTKDDPIYIIVDSSITAVKFNSFQTTGNERPIVLAYLGFGEVDIENANTGTIFNAVIYAPFATFKAGYQGTFNGSIIAKNIQMPYSGTGGDTRGQWNFKEYTKLNNDPDLKEVTDNIIQPELNNSIRNTIKKLWTDKHLIINGQELTAENIGDKNWYNELPFSEKRTLYAAFLDLCKDNSDLMKVLWTWDGSFNQDVPPPPNPSDPTITTTPDNIRLINPRVEANPFTIYGIQWKML